MRRVGDYPASGNRVDANRFKNPLHPLRRETNFSQVQLYCAGFEQLLAFDNL
jgi:hypothetical protein